MTALPEVLSRKLDELAAMPKCPEGSLQLLSFASGINPKLLAVTVYRRRLARGYTPKKTASRTSLSFLTTEQRAEYDRLKTYRYTRDEALEQMGITP